MSHPSIAVHLLPWHLARSEGFDDLIIRPLRASFQVECHAYPQDWPAAAASEPRASVFCQVLPDPAWTARQRHRVIWVPMFDDVECHPQSWWNQLPRNLHVVAYSDAVGRRAEEARLTTFRIRYGRHTDDLEPVVWTGERVCFYWNRRGLVSPRFLAQFCEVLRIDRLLFRDELDPGADAHARFTLPARLGRTVVEPFPLTSSRAEYWRALRDVNVTIAPRAFEGVGLVALEMLARGCALFAYDGPTLNEAITHGVDGYLLRGRSLMERGSRAARERLASALGRQTATHTFGPVSDRQDWAAIGQLDLPALGARALARQQAAYQDWRRQIPAMVSFITASTDAPPA